MTRIFNFFQAFCFVLLYFGQSYGLDSYTEKPTFLPTCHIQADEFTKCSTNSIQKLIDQLIVGIPEIETSFGPFDPMHVKNIYFKENENAVANVRANLSRVIVKGFSKTLIKQSKVSKKDYSWETKIFLPKMRMDAHYDMDGRILLIPLRGSGEIFIEIENLDILMKSKIQLYEKSNFTFYNITKIQVDLNMTKVQTYLSNLFNGASKEIERSTNRFFNENWRDFYEALKPIINDTVESILFDVMSKVFHLIPANFFIADIPTPAQLYAKKKTPQ